MTTPTTANRSPEPHEALLAFALGTFHTIVTILPIVIGLYLGGSFADSLGKAAH